MRAKASFTVEAAFVAPMVILALMFGLSAGITLHQETCGAVADIEDAEGIEAVKLFWQASRVEQITSMITQTGAE